MVDQEVHWLYIELQTAADKKDQCAAFLGRDTGALHARYGCPCQERHAALSTLIYGRLELTHVEESPI
ncbi:hypothetical protein Y032_0406g894 [Ancylostoma ceylanicum]|uniref:Uncharacterized protein n=1 Tax=Ancylostoma ceylanicum TaxID=53326 RepID=A0A016X248_9BILA|nr:hypothetical protein Y032_0406g894 [Ancylostoma ceylanicum]